jgi:hypothetical protein
MVSISNTKMNPKRMILVKEAEINNNSDTQSSDLTDHEVSSSVVTIPTIVDSEAGTEATDPLVILGSNERRVINIDAEQPGSCHSSLSTSETETPWKGVVEYRPCPPCKCKGDSWTATSAANCSSQMDVTHPASAATATGLRPDAVRNNHD